MILLNIYYYNKESQDPQIWEWFCILLSNRKPHKQLIKLPNSDYGTKEWMDYALL